MRKVPEWKFDNTNKLLTCDREAVLCEAGCAELLLLMLGPLAPFADPVSLKAHDLPFCVEIAHVYPRVPVAAGDVPPQSRGGHLSA